MRLTAFVFAYNPPLGGVERDTFRVSTDTRGRRNRLARKQVLPAYGLLGEFVS